MSSSGESYKKVRYDLRPAKQVERLMLIDAFNHFVAGGFPISDYHYIGMGSVHFYDYIIFHKYLGMHKMTSAEIDNSVTRRVCFNRPFRFVDVKIAGIGDVVLGTPRDERVVAWLDYDQRLEKSHLEDLAATVAHVAPGSIILFTTDLELPREPKTGGRSTKFTLEYYQQRIGHLLPKSWGIRKFTPNSVCETILQLISRSIEVGLQSRSDVSFEPFAQFTYRDGHKMLSIGGMICTKHERTLFHSCTVTKQCYFRNTLKESPFNIHVPVLTRRERSFLDSKMPSKSGWRPREFEISDDDLDAYRACYRFTPLFAELIA